MRTSPRLTSTWTTMGSCRIDRGIGPQDKERCHWP
jgi:hypothetical protein